VLGRFDSYVPPPLFAVSEKFYLYNSLYTPDKISGFFKVGLIVPILDSSTALSRLDFYLE